MTADRGPARSFGLALVLAAGCAMAAPVAGIAADDAASAPAHQRPAAHAHKAPGLDDRVELLARELDLDAGQRLELKKVLEQQRVQVAKVWDDTSLTGATKVGTTQAISDRTAQQIRDLLNEEQRKKYSRARVRETSVGTPGANVDAWTKPGKAS